MLQPVWHAGFCVFPIHVVLEHSVAQDEWVPSLVEEGASHNAAFCISHLSQTGHLQLSVLTLIFREQYKHITSM